MGAFKNAQKSPSSAYSSTFYLNCIFWSAYQQFFGASIVTNGTLSSRVRNLPRTQNYLSPASSASRVTMASQTTTNKPIITVCF